jgi:hypothetical protein
LSYRRPGLCTGARTPERPSIRTTFLLLHTPESRHAFYRLALAEDWGPRYSASPKTESLGAGKADYGSEGLKFESSRVRTCETGPPNSMRSSAARHRRICSAYKWLPVCGAGRVRRLRSFSAAFAAALPGTGVGAGFIFTEFKSALAGGFGGRL